MVEADFRATLVKLFNPEARPSKFIWSHDAHFKAGFPDLYWVAYGKSYHAELKVLKAQNFPGNNKAKQTGLWDLCQPIQRQVMKLITEAGGQARLIVLLVPPNDGPKQVRYLAWGTQHVQTYSWPEFKTWWAQAW